MCVVSPLLVLNSSNWIAKNSTSEMPLSLSSSYSTQPFQHIYLLFSYSTSLASSVISFGKREEFTLRAKACVSPSRNSTTCSGVKWCPMIRLSSPTFTHVRKHSLIVKNTLPLIHISDDVYIINWTLLSAVQIKVNICSSHESVLHSQYHNWFSKCSFRLIHSDKDV